MTPETMNADLNLHPAIDAACSKIAPLWPLSHFVAVNPFVGFADRSFAAAALAHKRTQGADTVLPLDWFKARFKDGAIGVEDVRAAVAGVRPEIAGAFEQAGETLSADRLIELLAAPAATEEPLYRAGSFSAYLDSREGTHWQHVIREEAAKWCAAYDDEGQSSWKFPWKDLGLYGGWKEAAMLDRNPEFHGLTAFRKQVALLPDDPATAINDALTTLEVPGDRIAGLLHKILLTLPGWAGHLRYKDRELEIRGGKGDALMQLLAILLNYEVVLYRNHASDTNRVLGWRRTLLEAAEDEVETAIPVELAQRIVWQSALEHAFEHKLRSGIRPRSGGREGTGRADVQAVFCIDVRSELFRRALESTSLKVRTFGFAGFFGLPIDHDIPGLGSSQARCPVLLAPPLKTVEGVGGADAVDFEKLRFERIEARENARGWKRFREAAASCFTFVETAGLSYAYKLVRDAFGVAGKGSGEQAGAPAFLNTPDLARRADSAEGILKGLGLTRDFARIVLFCGHGSETRNNPYGSGLDCGACGGHAGDANARLAASLLNQEDVRAALEERGIAIPADTRFIAGLHTTTTDEVSLFDTGDADPELVAQLRSALKTAGSLTILERAAKLGSAVQAKDVAKAVRGRSRDWSEVRPEWGLAGNAAFIVAPRRWTDGADLEGRAFLHDYDASADPEGAVLEQILGGPLVVGSWINLQYYGSATDNAHFGSGHKAIHNVVGGIGVALGNEYDLRPGLPLQSVHDGEKLVHEPLRLHACVAAEAEVLDEILSRQAHVRHLVENGWVHLIALGADGGQWLRRSHDGAWLGVSRQRKTA